MIISLQYLYINHFHWCILFVIFKATYFLRHITLTEILFLSWKYFKRGVGLVDIIIMFYQTWQKQNVLAFFSFHIFSDCTNLYYNPLPGIFFDSLSFKLFISPTINQLLLLYLLCCSNFILTCAGKECIEQEFQMNMKWDLLLHS